MAKRKRKRGDLTAQPHDAIIKFTFSQREHAAGLLKAAIEPEITAQLRWDTLDLEKIHFVDRGLRGRYADLLFSAAMGDERAFMHVLLEHQSTVDPLMIFRMGSTMWRRWAELVRDAPKRTTLPLIIPILIHHSATGWTAATAFESLFAIPEQARAAARRYVPCFEMKLVDVSRDPSGGLVKQALTDLGRVVLWCLSVAGNERRLEEEIDQLVAELNAVYGAPHELDAQIAVLRYLVATQPKVSAAKITNLLKTTARKGQKGIDMDRLDEWRNELARKARVEAKAGMLLGLLTARFGAVPADAKTRVLTATGPMLSRWSIRVLTAPTIDDVFGSGTTATKTVKKAVAPARRSVARKRARSAK